jgi:hypothetical protein
MGLTKAVLIGIAIEKKYSINMFDPDPDSDFDPGKTFKFNIIGPHPLFDIWILSFFLFWL